MTEIISPDNQLVDDGGISTQRTQIWLDQVTDLQIITGTGTPEGIVSANVSRLYLQTDGTDGAVLFIKQLSDIGGDPKYGWVVCGGGGSASIALEDLTDVTITSIATGELLKWNGSAWVNNTLSEAGVQPEEDQRLSTTDSVEFLSVTTGSVIATGNITVTGTVDGRDIAVDGIKLDGIEAGADVTDTDNVVASLTAGANITIAADGTISATSTGGNETLAQTLVLGNTTGGTDISVSTGDNIVVATGSTVDGRNISVDGTKLDGIEDNADVTDTANVTAAGALMDSEVVNLDQVKNFDSADYATAAQGVTADNALPLSGGTMTGVIANFQSTGIDDNATSTALTLDSSQNATLAGDINFSGASPNVLLDADNDRLVVSGGDATSSGANIIFYGDNHFSNANKMIFRNSGTTALTINASQDATFAGNVDVSSTGNPILRLTTTSATADPIMRYDTASGSASDWATGIDVSANEFVVSTGTLVGSNKVLRLNGATQNATFAGEIDASAGGIKLGGTAAANHLDDYEEGTWTPTNYSGGGVYNAKYIKIGNLVTVSAYFNGGTFTTTNIGGLPYSPSTSNRYVSGLIGYTDTTNVTASFTNTSSRLYFVNKTAYVTPNNDRMMIQVSYFVGI